MTKGVITHHDVQNKTISRRARNIPTTAGILLSIMALCGFLGILLGWFRPPLESVPSDPSIRWQLSAIVRITLTSLTVASVILGPGLLLRTWRPFVRLPIGFVPLPGILLMVCIGGLIWATDGPFSSGTRAQILTSLALLAISALAAIRPVSLTKGERAALGLAGLVLLVGLGRSLWSPTTPGELFAGTIGRTLEVGDRSDPRISYYLVTIISQGWNPNVPPGADLFAPWLFSDRGPLAGMFAAPIVLASGAHPTLGLGDDAWSPFDGQGFMVYRMAMMGLAVCLLPAAYSLVRLTSGPRVALVSTAVLGTTPFIVHEVYFTWPKLCAAAFCLLATYLVLIDKPILAGFLTGLGYLTHPLVLFSVPALMLLVILTAGNARRGRWLVAAKRLATFLLALGTIAYIWKAVNGPYYNQSKFTTYLYAAAGRPDVTTWTWIQSRLASAANTLVPFWLPLFGADGQPTNVWGGHSSNIVHFFFQYWNSLPFAIGIVFFPFAVMALVRLFRSNPWIMAILIVIPFVGFLIYWGFSDTGLLREGAHIWFISLVLLVGIELAPRIITGGRGAFTLRMVMLLRVAECLVMIMFPALVRSSVPGIDTGVIPVPPMVSVPITDATALVVMVVATVALGFVTFRATRPDTPGLGEAPAPSWRGILSPHPDDVRRFDTPRLRAMAGGWRHKAQLPERSE